jgi:putative membrane protein
VHGEIGIRGKDNDAMTLFSLEDQKRISDTIASVEDKTAGEVVAVVAPESGSYYYAPYLWASGIALLVPWPFIYLTWWPVQWIFAIQLMVFAALLALLYPKAIRLSLVPSQVKRQRAHRRAVEQFLTQNMTATAERTGVLIFVSVAERYAEVIPDTGIAQKVPAATWQDVVDALTADIGAGQPAEGFVKAIQAVGRHLSEHFPPDSKPANELPNHLIVLA